MKDRHWLTNQIAILILKLRKQITFGICKPWSELQLSGTVQVDLFSGVPKSHMGPFS